MEPKHSIKRCILESLRQLANSINLPISVQIYMIATSSAMTEFELWKTAFFSILVYRISELHSKLNGGRSIFKRWISWRWLQVRPELWIFFIPRLCTQIRDSVSKQTQKWLISVVVSTGDSDSPIVGSNPTSTFVQLFFGGKFLYTFPKPPLTCAGCVFGSE